MPLGSSSAAPVIRPGPTFARGCRFRRRQISASEIARRDLLSFLDCRTAPHRTLPAQGPLRTGPRGVHPLPQAEITRPYVLWFYRNRDNDASLAPPALAPRLIVQRISADVLR